MTQDNEEKLVEEQTSAETVNDESAPESGDSVPVEDEGMKSAPEADESAEAEQSPETPEKDADLPEASAAGEDSDEQEPEEEETAQPSEVAEDEEGEVEQLSEIEPPASEQETDAEEEAPEEEAAPQPEAIEEEEIAAEETAEAEERIAEPDSELEQEAVQQSEAVESEEVVPPEGVAAAEETAAVQDEQPGEEEVPAEAPKLEELLDDPDKKWYVIHAHSGHENKVRQSIENRVRQEQLDEFVGNVLIPSEEVAEVKGGKKRITSRKIFPGYVLVQMKLTHETWYLIRTTPGVTGFIGSGKTPTPLDLDEVKSIFEQMRGERKKPKPKMSFEKDDKVKIIEGPFTNFMGYVDEVNPERGKLKVMVEIFERLTSVELEFWQVEKT